MVRTHARTRGLRVALAPLVALVLAGGVPPRLVAQEPAAQTAPTGTGARATPVQATTPARTLSLEEAVALAARNNPAYLSALNDQGPADWQVREAFASLLPTVNASSGFGYQEPGVQRIGAIDLGAASSDYLYSSYALNVSWSLDGNSLFRIPAAQAERAATRARIGAAAYDLESAVTLRYMTALRARDGVDLARRQLDRAQQNLELARVRAEAGAVAMVDAKQAQVERGRAEVALLQAEREERAERLRLLERIGLEIEEDVALVSRLEVFEPTWSREDLLERALRGHPSLRALRAREAAGRSRVRQAKSAYFPSFNLTTGLRGSAIETRNKDFLLSQAEQSVGSRREDCEFLNAVSAGLSSPLPGYPRSCGQYVLTDAQRTDLLRQSEVFPFDFTKSPLAVTLQVSVPVFNGLSNQRAVEEAQASAADAAQGRRAEELRLRTEVTQALDDLATAYQIAQLERANRDVAREQLTLARQRYALGAANILELLDAQTSTQTAERAYLNALYDFQLDLTALEAASGVRLRAEL